MSDLPGLDLGALRRYLDRTEPRLLPGELSAELIAGGRSNLTYVVRADAGGDSDGPASAVRELVLRRPPLGHVQATAHDMAREHRVIGALAGSAVPVPRVLALCEDPEVLGAPFYLMERVPGIVLRRPADAAGLTSDARISLAHKLIDVLADLHDIDPAAVGLADLGRADGYLERQVHRWGRQLEGSRSREIARIDELHRRLGAGVPKSPRAAIVHGDYRLDNMLVAVDAAGAPSITAVLDWEMATLGDPLADIGLLLVYWDGLSAIDNPVATGLGAASGFPSGAELTARYLARTGLDGAALGWYVALGYFKLAVVLEGIHYRYVQGQTVGAGFDRIGDVVPVLVDLGLATLDGDGSTARGD